MKNQLLKFTVFLSFIFLTISCSAPMVLVGRTTIEDFTKRYSATLVDANTNRTVYRRRGAGNGFTDFTFYYFNSNGVLYAVDKGESQPNIIIQNRN